MALVKAGFVTDKDGRGEIICTRTDADTNAIVLYEVDGKRAKRDVLLSPAFEPLKGLGGSFREVKKMLLMRKDRGDKWHHRRCAECLE